ncbi:MAG: hypothetical protein JO147_07425 [Actinobacteria bacterium]|nr:hypothetical protein [Actinomycetota bacterium]
MSARDVASRALAALRAAGVPIGDGLTAAEIEAIEQHHAFGFNPDHRALLSHGVPLGPRWVDWRCDDPDRIAERLLTPIRGVLFDVEHNGFWAADWGPRPVGRAALSVAARALERVPRLIPVYGHRFAPAAPAPSGSPILSVVQTDVVEYGHDLGDYVAREFRLPSTASRAVEDPGYRVPFWSDLISP